jgi:hypothetical protein
MCCIVTFFSVTIDGRNLIFGGKLLIGTPYHGKRFWIHQIPTSCLLTLLIFIHIEHTCICSFFVAFNVTKNVHIQCMFNVYKNQQSRQTGSRNLTGQKTLPTIWYTYMTLVAKYCGKRFWTHRIPTSCLPTLLIFMHIEHTHVYAHFSSAYLYEACDQISDSCHQ